MHRRLQFGMRENPASDRRHGSRSVVGSEESSNYLERRPKEEPSADARGEGPAIIPENAAHLAATGKKENVIESSDLERELPRHGGARREAFEPLLGSVQAAMLLGNIHVKTLQRYARLGRVPGYQIGGHWYFRASELDSWLRCRINSSCHPCRSNEEAK